MSRRSGGFPAHPLAAALALVWTMAVGLAAASDRPPTVQPNGPPAAKASAERAVDAVIARGEIPKTLPFVRREAVKAVKGNYPSQDAAADTIARTLREFYRTSYESIYMSKRQDVEKAVAGAQHVYRRNVFPEMHVQFGTYPNNIGHMDFPGCFRCHDDNHQTKDGRKIGQDCDTCHDIQ